MASPLATVIIPNYNGRRFLPKLMESLSAQRGVEFAITVVDDVSTDDSVEYLKGQWPNIELIRNAENVGFAASCNVGIRAATTPFVVLLNNDTHVEPDWLTEGLQPFDAVDVGAVASLTLLAEPPHLVDTAGDVYSVAGGAMKRCHLQPRDRAEGLSGAPFSPSGVSAFYRREAVLQAGLLDEEFESYYEDVDLGFRLTWAGYRCVFAPKSICYHHLSASYDPRSWRYHFNSARNAEIVWWSNMPRRWRYLPTHLAFLFMQFIHKNMQGVGLAYLCGKLNSLTHFSYIREKRRRVARLASMKPAEVESRLVRNWWHLHMSARGPVANPGGDA